MEDIIIGLQETLAHQEQEVARMSEELYTQQQEISILRQQIIRLEAKLIGMIEEGLPTRSIDQEAPPPHY